MKCPFQYNQAHADIDDCNSAGCELWINEEGCCSFKAAALGLGAILKIARADEKEEPL